MRDDLVGGLRNALERGFTIDQAIKSFVSAGYHESDVREAAQQIDTGVTSMMPTQQTYQPQISKPQPVQKLPVQPIMQQPKPRPVVQRPQPVEFEVKTPHQRPSFLIIALVFVLLLSIAGFVASLLFKEQIASFLGG